MIPLPDLTVIAGCNCDGLQRCRLARKQALTHDDICLCINDPQIGVLGAAQEYEAQSGAECARYAGTARKHACQPSLRMQQTWLRCSISVCRPYSCCSVSAPRKKPGCASAVPFGLIASDLLSVSAMV